MLAKGCSYLEAAAKKLISCALVYLSCMVAPLPESDTLKNKSENIHRGASPGTHYADSMLTKLAAEFAFEDRSQEKMKVTCGGVFIPRNQAHR